MGRGCGKVRCIFWFSGWIKSGFVPEPSLSKHGTRKTSKTFSENKEHRKKLKRVPDINRTCVIKETSTSHRKKTLSPVSVEEQPSCCAQCQDLLKDPVSSSCGHWFCKKCFTSSKDFICPKCGKKSKRGTCTSEIIQKSSLLKVSAPNQVTWTQLQLTQ